MKLKRFIPLLLGAVLLCAPLSACGGKTGEYTVGVNVGNTCGNISNLGALCETGDRLYYQKADDDLSLYSSALDGSDEVKLNDVQSYFINVTEEYIVYANAEDDFHIYRMKHDGSENTKLNDVQSYYVSVMEDVIYYSNWSDENKPYSMNMDGSDNKAIGNDQAYYLSAYKGKLYYSNWSDNMRLYSMDVDGQNKLRMTEYACQYIVPYGDWIYYSRWEDLQSSQSENPEDRYLCRTALDSSAEEVILEKPCGDINVYKDRIYFTDWTNDTICSVATDGSDFNQHSEEYGTYLNTGADKLFYVVFDDSFIPTLKSITIGGNTNGDN